MISKYKVTLVTIPFKDYTDINSVLGNIPLL